MANQEQIDLLKDYANSNKGIISIVARDTIDTINDPTQDTTVYLKGIVNNCGCAGGACSGLIYYKDTHKFYNENYQEIEELRQKYEDNVGQPIKITYDLKNFFAWFAYEEVCRKLLEELTKNK